MHTHLAGNHCLAQAMVMKAGDLVSLSFGQLMVSHGVPLCFFGEKKRTRTGSWPLLSYAPWVLQLLSEFASFYLRTQWQRCIENTDLCNSGRPPCWLSLAGEHKVTT
ncbi:hypothetical protein [Klebsiella pneumoniae]|uniref:hypothetical protein n=1 Tax=Klebsiella pneumoniae TaxID=573 RepID=UPI00388F3D4C